jgi:hypothetical protein
MQTPYVIAGILGILMYVSKVKKGKHVTSLRER